MTEPNSRPPADVLEQAVTELRATPVPAGPSAELVTATTRALQGADGAPPRRNPMVRIALGSIAVAATVLLAVGAFFFLPRPDPSPDTRTGPAALKAPTVEVEGATYLVQGPFSHQDLTVFLLCSDRQDKQDFL